MGEEKLNKELLRKMFIVFFALIGFFTTVKLAIIYYDSNFNPYALPSFCSVNNFIDCDGVAQTIHSQFFGIPLSYWGMFLYVFIIFLVFVQKLKNIKFLGFLEIFKNPLAYISALGFISFAISIGLAVISIFEIKKVCVLCIFTYFLNLFIAIAATEKSLWENFKTSIKDFFDAIKVKKYMLSLLSVLTLAGCFLLYTSISCVFAPQVKRIREFKKYDKMKDNNPFKVEGNILGDKDGKLIVYIYTDYECPICRTYNVITHRAATELSGFKVVHKNLPLDNECNENVLGSLHKNSCLYAKYAIASEKQNRFWDMNTELFEQQPEDEQAVLKMAESMGLNTMELKKDAHSEQTAKRLQEDIKNSETLNILGTPSIVINGKIYAGIKPYYELKEILLKAGANERK